MGILRHLYRNLLDHEYAWLRLLGFGLAIRIILLMVMRGEPLVGDGLEYHVAAKALVQNGTLNTYWPPGVPLYQAIWIWLFGTDEIWARISALPWFLLLCRTFYRITYVLHSRVTANIGVAILAVYPAFVHQSVEPMSYLPAAVLLLSVFGQVQAYFGTRKHGRLWQGGFQLGLLVLFRPASALFVLVLPALIMFRRLKIFPAAAIIFTAVAVTGPWIWFASIRAGRFIPINEANARNVYLGNNSWTPSYQTWYFGSHWTGDPNLPAGFRKQLHSIEALPPSEQGMAYQKAAWLDIQERPLVFAERTASRFRTLLAFDTLASTRLHWSHHSWAIAWPALSVVEGLSYAFLCLAAMAFWFTDARRDLGGEVLGSIWGFLVVYALPYWFSFSHPSFHLPMLPLLLIPAVVWAQRCISLGHLPKVGRRGKWALILCTTLFLAIQCEWAFRMFFHNQ